MNVFVLILAWIGGLSLLGWIILIILIAGLVMFVPWFGKLFEFGFAISMSIVTLPFKFLSKGIEGIQKRNNGKFK